MDKNSPNWCEACQSEHGALYVCKNYSKERKEKIEKSIPKPPKNYLFKIDTNAYVVWMSKDENSIVVWVQGLFMGGYNAYKRVSANGVFENITYGTIYVTEDAARKALGILE
jgi:hypothetical protein